MDVVNTVDPDASPHGVEHSSSCGIVGLASVLLFYDAYRGFLLKSLYLNLVAALGMTLVLSISEWARSVMRHLGQRPSWAWSHALPNATVVLKEVEGMTLLRS